MTSYDIFIYFHQKFKIDEIFKRQGSIQKHPKITLLQFVGCSTGPLPVAAACPAAGFAAWRAAAKPRAPKAAAKHATSAPDGPAGSASTKTCGPGSKSPPKSLLDSLLSPYSRQTVTTHDFRNRIQLFRMFYYSPERPFPAVRSLPRVSKSGNNPANLE